MLSVLSVFEKNNQCPLWYLWEINIRVIRVIRVRKKSVSSVLSVFEKKNKSVFSVSSVGDNDISGLVRKISVFLWRYRNKVVPLWCIMI